MIKMKTPGSQCGLADLPNIGPTVARLLVIAGIRTPQQLKRAGAVGAADRIRKIRPDDPPCRSMLAGLEGAIRGVRWHTIPKADREALWREYERDAGGKGRRREERRPRPLRGVS